MVEVVALSGFMGSGKSSIGRSVASRLGRRFIDLDSHIEERERSSIEGLFAERGEVGFRRIEAEALANVLDGEHGEGTILALGGGTVTWPDSAQRLAAGAFVVLVSVPVDDLWRRVRGTGRPLAQSKKDFFALARARYAAYRGTADAVVEVAGLDVEEAAEVIVELVRAREARVATVPRRERPWT